MNKKYIIPKMLIISLVFACASATANAQWITFRYGNYSNCANGQCSSTSTAKPVANKEEPKKTDCESTVTAVQGKWCYGSDSNLVGYVDSAVEENASKLGIEIKRLEACWKKFPVYWVSPVSGFAGCTWGGESGVSKMEIVTAYDDESHRVIKRECGHAIIFNLLGGSTLFNHEGVAQEMEPNKRVEYINKAKQQLASNTDLVSWFERENYDNGLRLYTYSYVTFEYLRCLGGSHWMFGFVEDAHKTGFRKALNAWYGITPEELNTRVHEFTKNDGNVDKIKSLY